MGHHKIKQLTLRAWTLTFFMFFLVAIVLSWISYHYLRPFPPKTFVMATGMEDGSYAAFGEAYRQALARDGVRLVLRQTSGAMENLALLKDGSREVKAGFVQSIVGGIERSSNLVSLGSLAYTPLWVFYKGKDTYDDLAQLRGKRIAIGPEGSGINKFSLELLELAGAISPSTTFLHLPYIEANRALREDKADAIMIFGSPDNPLVRDLLDAKGVKLMNMSQAEAYARRFPDLSHVVLPKGIIDPAKKNPLSDIHLLSPTTNLIVRKDLHPALVYLLLKASVELYSGAGWINKAGEFPMLAKQDDPLSDQAQRYYKTGGSWLYAYLPFWMATFFERLILILVPLGMIIVPLIGVAPWIYTWRNRSKYYPWYRELRELEKEFLENRSAENIDQYRTRLDRIEEAVGHIRTSVAFYDELYILKEHIQIVRLKLDTLSQNMQ